MRVRSLIYAYAVFGALCIPGSSWAQFPSVPDLIDRLPKPPKIPSVPDIEGRLPRLGHETNRPEVHRSLEEGGWWVAYGKDIGGQQYVEFTAAIAASVAAHNPEPAMGYLTALIDQSIATLEKNAGKEFGNQLLRLAKQQIVDAISNALSGGRPRTIRLAGIDVQAGVATINHKESGIPLPNSFEPYIRVRLRTGTDNSSQATGTGKPRPGFETGVVDVRNNYGGDVKLLVFHADAPTRVFGSWKFGPQQRFILMERNGKKIVAGSNWQVEVVFGNGVRSHRHPLSQVAQYREGRWELNLSRIYNGG
jgi:hypothetical protein